MTQLEQIAQTFVLLMVQAEVHASPEERADVCQSVLDEAGFFAHVEPWEPGTEFGPGTTIIVCHSVLRIGISGLDEVESLLWFMGLLDTMPRGKFEDEVQHVVNRMLRSKKRREDEEELDNTDYETLEEAENEVQGVIAERPSLWAMIANQIRSG